MRTTSVLTKLLGIEQTRVSAVRFETSGLILTVKPTTRRAHCGGCLRRCRRVHDRRRRQWRHLDMAGMECHLEAVVRRVKCTRCGVTTELVPWAEHASGFTRDFETTLAYLAQHADQTTVCTTMRVAWTTVGRVASRVVERELREDPLEGLTRIGIDELSYRRHHEYITIITDHVRGRVVWAAPGKNADTVRGFFATLGKERAERIEAVTIDMSQAYATAVREACPNAAIIYDRFHVQRLAHDALDRVRREQWRAADVDDKRAIKGTRFALQKRAWNMSDVDEGKLRDVQRTNRPLYRAYLLKETLAAILDGGQVNVARDRLLEWVAWAQRSKLAPFRRAAKTIKHHIEGIVAYVQTGLSNARSEGMNGKVRTITRRSFGLHSAWSLIGLVMLCCSGIVLRPILRRPALPLNG
jgi:transposase